MKNYQVIETNKKTEKVTSSYYQAETCYDLFLDLLQNHDDEHGYEKISDYSENDFTCAEDVAAISGRFFDDTTIDVIGIY